MKCYAFTINLKDDPEVIRQYDAYHRSVPPAVVENAKNAGIVKSKIYRLGRHLFMFIETTDDFQPSGGIAKAQVDPEVKKWVELMDNFQEKHPDARADEWWAQMQLINEF